MGHEIKEGVFLLAFLALCMLLFDAFFLARCNLPLKQRHAPQDEWSIYRSLTARRLRGTGAGLLFFTADGLPQPLDLNRATEEELTLLPGIGPKRALKIIDARYETGFFLTKEELTSPYGPLPPALYWAIASYIR